MRHPREKNLGGWAADRWMNRTDSSVAADASSLPFVSILPTRLQLLFDAEEPQPLIGTSQTQRDPGQKLTAFGTNHIWYMQSSFDTCIVELRHTERARARSLPLRWQYSVPYFLPFIQNASYYQKGHHGIPGAR